MRSVIKFIFPLSHVMYFDICSGIRMGLCRVHISKFKFFRYLIFVKVLEAVFYIKLYFRLVPVLLRNLCQVFSYYSTTISEICIIAFIRERERERENYTTVRYIILLFNKVLLLRKINSKIRDNKLLFIWYDCWGFCGCKQDIFELKIWSKIMHDIRFW